MRAKCPNRAYNAAHEAMQPTLLDGTTDLPAPVAGTLTAFVSAAAGALGPDLRSVVLFGSGAENRLRPTSDVNVVVVLRAFDADRVQALSETLLAGRAAVRLNVMWLLESEIPLAVEAFTVKFADIARRRRVVWGPDIFEGVSIPRHAAIARLRQVLMNLVLRLRASYAMHSHHEERLAFLVADAAGPLRASAAEIIALEGSAPPSPREALEAIARTLPTDGWSEALAAITEARHTRAVAPGTGGPLLLKVIELACHLLNRATALPHG
jgi:predicted nucleotidyltransferase